MKHVKTGERTILGGVWTKDAARLYNELSDRIASYEAQGREAPEYLLNGRHNLYCAQSRESEA